MWLFITQYKKVLALCAIPFIAVVTWIGFEVMDGKGNRSEPLAVNLEMKALLDRDVEQTTTPSPKEVNIPEQAQVASKFPDSKPRRSAKPKATPKPKATSKSKAASKPKEQQNLNFKVNINQASPEEFMKLKGIGESKAKEIIAYRVNHSFQTVEELMKVKGIGPKIFENIKEHLEL